MMFFKVIEEEGLQNNCKVLGKFFIEELMLLKKVHPIIGDVRGKGLMLGIELVKPGTKEPLDPESLADIFENIKDMGIIVGRGGRKANVSSLKQYNLVHSHTTHN